MNTKPSRRFSYPLLTLMIVLTVLNAGLSVYLVVTGYPYHRYESLFVSITTLLGYVAYCCVPEGAKVSRVLRWLAWISTGLTMAYVADSLMDPRLPTGV